MQGVRWAEDVVDNEFAGKRKSKSEGWVLRAGGREGSTPDVLPRPGASLPSPHPAHLRPPCVTPSPRCAPQSAAFSTVSDSLASGATRRTATQSATAPMGSSPPAAGSRRNSSPRRREAHAWLRYPQMRTCPQAATSQFSHTACTLLTHCLLAGRWPMCHPLPSLRTSFCSSFAASPFPPTPAWAIPPALPSVVGISCVSLLRICKDKQAKK